MRKPMTACFFFLLSFGLLFQPQAQGADPASRNVILSTTTSTQDSGLLDVLIPLFEKQRDILSRRFPWAPGRRWRWRRKGMPT